MVKIEEFVARAKDLKERYDEADCNSVLACLMDECADFLDEFIEEYE